MGNLHHPPTHLRGQVHYHPLHLVPELLLHSTATSRVPTTQPPSIHYRFIRIPSTAPRGSITRLRNSPNGIRATQLSPPRSRSRVDRCSLAFRTGRYRKLVSRYSLPNTTKHSRGTAQKFHIHLQYWLGQSRVPSSYVRTF